MLTIRREVLEYGSLPTASWLQHIDSHAALHSLLRRLVQASTVDSRQNSFVDLRTLANCLDVSLQHVQILVDTLESVAPLYPATVQRLEGRTDVQVDAHAVVLYLFAQLYIRLAQRPDSMDIWPTQKEFRTDTFASLAEPSSPGRAGSLRSGNHTLGGGHFHFQHQRSNHLVRKELQQHLQQHQHLLHGYCDYLQRHIPALLPLLSSKPGSDSDAAGSESNISCKEFDRLGLLLCSSASRSDMEDSTTPMDLSPPSVSMPDNLWRLSSHVPALAPFSEDTEASVSVVEDWLARNIIDDSSTVEALVGAASPSPIWQELPPAGVVQGCSEVDVQGVCKSTIVRGEDAFPAGVVRITDCHDTIVYALAPLEYAALVCCSDCTVVLGAVGKMVRVEKCERLQLIAACTRVCISSCHDCIFYLGVNHPPLLIGDNRFLQMAPYNTQYERLQAHMASAGVSPDVNKWDQVVTLEQKRRNSADAAGSLASNTPPPYTLLPPDRLLPFTVPFKGGPGPMCGGDASGSVPRWSTDFGSLAGLAENSAHSCLPATPFPLPPAYEQAKERKVQSVAELRNAVKKAGLDDNRKKELQVAIQSFFKDWLLQSGNMRQIYDLARMERREDEQGQSLPG